MALGKGAVGPPEVLLERVKRLLKVWEVTEPRRGRLRLSLGGELSLLLEDMMRDEGCSFVGRGKAYICMAGERLVKTVAALFSFGVVFVD